MYSLKRLHFDASLITINIRKLIARNIFLPAATKLQDTSLKHILSNKFTLSVCPSF
ncbi:hypothetical protein Scep_016896 [Stephania cephalantha]|uniref:Uncharacterized protein n=1 Tax=Stephania cephalantha TaxID=152367 RepID=A0AAP0IPV5_9MAGN